MTSAAQILSRKSISASQVGDPVAGLPPDAMVIEAASLMNERHIGSVLVLDSQHHAIGIFTERDVMRRIVAANRDPHTTQLESVMTSPVACARPNTTIDELRSVMREKRIRHIPVLDDDERVMGMISIGDLNQAEINTQVQTIRYLHQYISAG